MTDNYDIEREKLELEKQKLEIERMKLQQQMNNTFERTSTSQVGSPQETIDKLNSIKKLSIASLVLVIVGIFGIILSTLLISFIVPIIMIFVIVAGGICELIASIKILATDFKNKEINDSKLLWGLLSLLLIGFIGSLIFVSISKNKVNNN